MLKIRLAILGIVFYAIAIASIGYTSTRTFPKQALQDGVNESSLYQPSPTPLPTIMIPYTVQYGDTLASVANHFGIDQWTLARLNGVYNFNFIYVGQILIVPYSGPPPNPYPVSRAYTSDRNGMVS